MNSTVDEPLRIAVVDDDPIFCELTCAIISSGTDYIALPAESGNELFEILKKHRIGCILLDYNLGAETGLSIKKDLDRQFPEAPPVIMLTGDGRERTAIDAFRMGVSDYLPKLGMTPDTLLAMISTVIADEQARLQTKSQHIRLARAATVDPVTGLSGRAHLEERLTQLAQLSPEDRRAYTVVTAQRLEYQPLTDHYGLDVAESALHAFGQKVKDLQQEGDLCGRYAEGTFLIIKHFRSDPATVDEVCRRSADFLSFTMTTPFAMLKLSARVAITICGSDTPAEFDQWSRLASSANTMLKQEEPEKALCRDEMLERDSIRASAETMINTFPLQRPELPRWVYAPL